MCTNARHQKYVIDFVKIIQYFVVILKHDMAYTDITVANFESIT